MSRPGTTIREPGVYRLPNGQVRINLRKAPRENDGVSLWGLTAEELPSNALLSFTPEAWARLVDAVKS